MAEVVAGGIRVQAVLQGKSGLPEDRYVNTWHFADIGGGPTVDADVELAVLKTRSFYMDSGPTYGAVWNWLASGIIDWSTSFIHGYDLSVDEPRVPVGSVGWGGFVQGGTPLPSEVACCASFFSLVNQPSARGRIYLGPLGQTADTTSETTPSRPAAGLIADLCGAMKALALAPGPIWSILTHPGGGAPVLKTVTGGWVDNSFDTQRRRGEDSTERLSWSV